MSPKIQFFEDNIIIRAEKNYSALQAVDHRADVAEDAVELAEAIYVVVDTLALVPLDKRSGLVVVNVEALLDCLCIVVRAAALLTTLDKTCHKLFLRNVKLYHSCYLMTTLCKHLLKSLCLWDSAGESVEDNTLVFLAKAVVNASEDVYHKVIRYELTIVYKTLGCFAKFCSVLDFVA